MKMLMEIEEVNCEEALPLLSLNHVSLVVRSVWSSVSFYEHVLGFFLVKRPSSFNFHGAWLFNYGIGIHLLESESIDNDDYEEEKSTSRPINPKDNHISFQCTDVEVVKRKLEKMGMKYVTGLVKEGGIEVDQVFFHDPDGYMIEICNCNVLPVLPLSSCSSFKPNNIVVVNNNNNNNNNNTSAPATIADATNLNNLTAVNNCWMMETAMMESLSMDMMNFSF